MTKLSQDEHLALEAIKQAHRGGDEAGGVALYVDHHLDELERTYWCQRLGTATPEPAQVLGLLELRGHWVEDEREQVFDFSLPGEVTQYVLSVTVNEIGEVVKISMES